MRWQVTLQLAIGFAALFASAYFGVERFIGPPLERSAVDSAEAHAIVGASEVASTWEKSRVGRRNLVHALSASPALREESPERLEAALESAAVQLGADEALLLRADGEKLATFGKSSADLAGLVSTADAQRGAVIVRFERIGGVLHAVAAAPLFSSDGHAEAALVVASKLGESELRRWIRTLPDDITVTLLEGDRVVASTTPARFQTELGHAVGSELNAAGSRFRVARRALVDDAGTQLSVVGLGMVAPLSQSPVIQRARLLVLALGVISLVLALALVLIALGDNVRDLIEGYNASQDLPRMGGGLQSMEPMALDPNDLRAEPMLEPLSTPLFSPPPPPSRSRPENPPLSTPTPSFSSPFSPPPVDSGGHNAKRDRPNSDTQLALDAERSLRGKPTPPPPPAPPTQPHARPAGAPIPFSSSDAIPLPGHAPAPQMSGGGRSPPPASPFDQIAAAAFAAPPPPLAIPEARTERTDHRRPPLPRQAPKEDDLLMPKGADLEVIAREAAKQGPPKYEPTNLPGLRAPFSGAPNAYDSGLAMPVGLPSQRSADIPGLQRSTDLPGLRADDPAARAFDRAPASPNTPQRRTSDPWASPAMGVYSTTPPVQERLAVPDRVPSNPPGFLNTPSQPPGAGGPVAYDEDHYRVVYNDFVASKARLGEVVDNITYEGFRSKLRSSEEALINRHGCRAVRFQVLVKDNTVSLRPQLVR